MRGAAGADELVVDEVGRHAHEGEVAPALPDDLVAGGERDQVREALERDDVAVVDEARDRVGKRGILAGSAIGRCLPSARRWPYARAAERVPFVMRTFVLKANGNRWLGGRSRKRPVDAAERLAVTFSI